MRRIVAKLTHKIEINNFKILDTRLVVVYNSAENGLKEFFKVLIILFTSYCKQFIYNFYIRYVKHIYTEKIEKSN